MTLVVSEAVEADLPILINIMLEAFTGDAYMAACFPGGNTPENRALAASEYLKLWRATPQIRMLKCVDTTISQIIGYAVWHVCDQERPESEWNQGAMADYLEDGKARQTAQLFMETMMQARKNLFEGRPHCFCSVMCVLPDHQRRGVGKILLQWGIDEADKAGIPSYLEASRFGRPLYLKLGFKDVEGQTIVVKAEQYGASEDAVYVPMIRPVPGEAK